MGQCKSRTSIKRNTFGTSLKRVSAQKGFPLKRGVGNVAIANNSSG
jgi:hypothetical protein